MGKTVPEDYSLVCFDYSEETYRQEDVTCSVEQGFEMGRQLALRLMEMISTGECDEPELHLCHEAHPLRWPFHPEDQKGKIKILPEAVLLSGRISLSVLLCQKMCSSMQARKHIGKELLIRCAKAVASRGIPISLASAPAEQLISTCCASAGRAALCQNRSGLWENQAHLQRYSGSDFPASTHPEHKSHRDKGFRHLLR